MQRVREWEERSKEVGEGKRKKSGGSEKVGKKEKQNLWGEGNETKEK